CSVDDDLVRSLRGEHRQVHLLPAEDIRLDARFRRAADRRTEIEIKTGADGAVCKLDKARRLEAFAPVDVDVYLACDMPDGAADRTEVAVGDAPAVVGIGGIDEMVVGLEAYVAVARARGKGQWGQRGERGPLGLRVAIGRVDEVVLIAPKVPELAIVV